MYKCKYCGEEFENKYKLAGHTTHCKSNPNYHHNFISTNNLKGKSCITQRLVRICCWCGREFFTNKPGIKFHENRCPNNPDRKKHPGNKGWDGKGKGAVGHKAWNKGLTKETDERLKIAGEKYSQHYKDGLFTLPKIKHTEETKKKLSILQQERIKNNPDLIKSCGRAKKYNYKGVTLDGTWELEFAKYLDKENIKWIRPKEGFEYSFENNKHYYFPDFYLLDLNVYVEIKGYEREIDQVKWKSLRDLGDNIVIIKQSQIQSIKKGAFDIYNYIKTAPR